MQNTLLNYLIIPITTVGFMSIYRMYLEIETKNNKKTPETLQIDFFTIKRLKKNLTNQVGETTAQKIIDLVLDLSWKKELSIQAWHEICPFMFLLNLDCPVLYFLYSVHNSNIVWNVITVISVFVLVIVNIAGLWVTRKIPKIWFKNGKKLHLCE